MDTFLDLRGEHGWKDVSLDQNENVTYKDMTVLAYNSKPLSNITALSTIEIKVFLTASGVK